MHVVKDGKYQISDAQAKAILELRLQRLTGMERDKLAAETEEIAREEMDLLSDRMLSNTVIEDWSYELEETEETGIGDISNDNAGTSKHHLFDK